MQEQKVLSKPFGIYQTNCYILSDGENELIIDPGVKATSWVMKNVKNPLAILNTHGHFDHIWSDCELRNILKVPIYIHKKDAFMLEDDIFEQNIKCCTANELINDEEKFNIGNFTIKFIHFPGHTPGCCIIETGKYWFSGDFIFKDSIGRIDFPYSNPKQMKQSLEKFFKISYDKKVYTGHGDPTTIKNEQKNIIYWLKML